MELLTALSSLTDPASPIARRNRFGPDCESGSRRTPPRDARRVIILVDAMPLCGHPVEPGEPQHRIRFVLKPGQTKTRPFRAAHRSDRAGDPQTYALLHCSVFKERTLPPSPFRTGSLTAPRRRGVRVNEGYLITACPRCQHRTGRSYPPARPQPPPRRAVPRLIAGFSSGPSPPGEASELSPSRRPNRRRPEPRSCARWTSPA